jgi:hypothetical protein
VRVAAHGVAYLDAGAVLVGVECEAEEVPGLGAVADGVGDQFARDEGDGVDVLPGSARNVGRGELAYERAGRSR